MMRIIASIILLFFVLEQVASVHVTHFKLDDEHLIKVGKNSYGLTGPELDCRNISSIVVNQETVRKIDFDCTETLSDLSRLDEDEKDVMDSMSQELHLVSNPSKLKAGQKYAITLYSSKGNLIDSARGLKSSAYRINQYKVLVHDGEYSVISTKEPLPFDWLMYFVFSDRVAFVQKSDSQLHLSQIQCLQGEQRSFIGELEKKLVDAKILEQSSF